MRTGKILACSLAVLALGGCATAPQGHGVAQNTAPVCLPSYNIDHTDIPNDSTILFTMRDRTVWKNTLVAPCYGLKIDSRGFTYAPTDPGSDTICSNLVTIRTNTDHNVCLLGEFTKVSGPKHS